MTEERQEITTIEHDAGRAIVRGIQNKFLPTNMAEAMEFASMMAGSNFVPKHLREKPGDCLAVVLQADRWEMDPFMVANKSYFVNDRMAYEAQLVAAVVNTARILDGRLSYSWAGSGNDLECTVTGKIRGDADIKTRTVKLSTIKTKNSPLWVQDPEQQIGYFTGRAWARLHTPEVLMGVYTPDEIETIDGGELRSNSPLIKPLTKEMLDNQADGEVDTVEDEKAPESSDPSAGEATKKPAWHPHCATLLKNIEATTGKDALSSCDDRFTELQAEYPDMSDAAFNAIDEALNSARKRIDNPEQEQK